jgi:phage-related protein
MSDIPLPAYKPVYPITKVMKPRQRTAKLPDWGTEQRKTVGQNQTSPEWSVRWILTPAEADILDTFLAERARNGEWFLWTPPGGIQGRYRCDEWTKLLPNCAWREFEATFRHVYSYARLPQNELLEVVAGVFNLTGQVSTLVKAAYVPDVLEPLAGVFALTGNPATTTKGAGLDGNAAAYIAAVEAADGQTLEAGVKIAISNFVAGCKTDGTWNAIKASCILAGARTLSGALVPLAGTAPTNFNFWGAADPYWANVSLLLRMNGTNGSTTFIDSSPQAYTINAYNGAQISTASPKYGSGALLLDGVNDVLAFTPPQSGLPASPLYFGAGSLTWECWAKITTGQNTIKVIAHNVGGWSFGFWDTDKFYARGPNAGTYEQTSGPYISNNTWTHVAFTYNGAGLVELFVAGTKVYSATQSPGIDQGQNFIVGMRPFDNVLNGPGDRRFSGQIDELRITKGVVRYTANFTPQAAAGPVSDYDRKTGLVGDGSTKYLNSNRNNSADPQNSRHLSAWVSTAATSAASKFPAYVSAGGNADGATGIGRLDSNSSDLYSRNANSDFQSISGAGSATAFIGTSRSASGSYVVRHGGNNSTLTQASEALANAGYGVFREIDGTSQAGMDATYSNARLAFYSIGESLDLALLDSRVTTLVNAIAAAIP